MKPVEKLVVVYKNIPNLVDDGVEIGFHDHLVESDMEIIEHLVMDDPIAMGDLIMSNEILSVGSLEFVGDATNMDLVLDLHVVIMVVDLDALVYDMDGCDKLHVDCLVVIQMLLMFGWLKKI